jgi:hypothetical protein
MWFCWRGTKVECYGTRPVFDPVFSGEDLGSIITILLTKHKSCVIKLSSRTLIGRPAEVGGMGRPGPDRKVTTDEVLAIFRDLDDPCRPLTRKDIAEKLDCSPPTAGKRLTELVEDGKLQTRKVGAKGRVWWRSVNKY